MSCLKCVSQKRPVPGCCLTSLGLRGCPSGRFPPSPLSPPHGVRLCHRQAASFQRRVPPCSALKLDSSSGRNPSLPNSDPEYLSKERPERQPHRAPRMSPMSLICGCTDLPSRLAGP